MKRLSKEFKTNDKIIMKYYISNKLSFSPMLLGEIERGLYANYKKEYCRIYYSC